jgi:hypothetical protein
MTDAEAKMLAAKLFAAFPNPKPDNLTTEVYVENLIKLPIAACALEAIDDLIRTETFRPPVALIVEDYHRLKPKYLPPALSEPPMSEEQIAENLRQSKLMVERLSHSMQMPTENVQMPTEDDGLVACQTCKGYGSVPGENYNPQSAQDVLDALADPAMWEICPTCRGRKRVPRAA